MNVNPFHTFTYICTSLAIGCQTLSAAYPTRDLKDLMKLETRVKDVSARVMPATVALISETTGSSGSGIITTSDGLILTAAHVVQGVEEMTVVFPDGVQVLGKVLGANYSRDIAMVQMQGKGPWPFAEMGTSKPLAAGDWVIAMGHSAGYDASRTPPVRFGHVVSEGPGYFLTTDCTLIGGDSGGPLFDLDGKIVGINSSIGVSLTNNNHAGIDGFKDDWDRIRAGEQWGELTMNPLNNSEMPVLGIVMGRPRGISGVPVEAVVSKSPSAAAGVRVGDVIQSLDGLAVLDASNLLIVLAKQHPGDKVKLGILRERQTLVVEVVLARHQTLYQN